MSTRLSALYRTAFVTGASAGLGRAFGRMLLDEGVEVWGTARDPRRLPSAPGFHPVGLELGDGAAAERTYREAEREAGGFDIVVNNAGYSVFGRLTATDFAPWRAQLEAMLLTNVRLSQVALKGLIDRSAAGRRGALVNVSSLAAEFPLPYQAAYNVAKAGLSALSESLMYEARATGVAVIDLRPGDYRTEFEGSVQRPEGAGDDAQRRVWAAFSRMMTTGPAPAHAAAALRRALLRGESGTVRTGRFFQARLAPLLARLAPAPFRRAVQAWYFGLP